MYAASAFAIGRSAQLESSELQVAMAESEEQEVIPETEAGQYYEEDATAQAAADEYTEYVTEEQQQWNDNIPPDGVEPPQQPEEAVETDPAAYQEEYPAEDFVESEQQTTEYDMAETSADAVAVADQVPAEDVPADEQPVETPADVEGETDEAAVIEAEQEPATERDQLTDMQALENDLTQFRHCIENIGTQIDDEMNRQDMRKLRASIREKATRMENDLKERQKTKDQMEPQERIHLQQVIKQLDTQLTNYHELLERERAMTRRYPLVGTNLNEPERFADQAATPSQAQAMLRNNVRDREQEHIELMELERDILGLNDIQTDLAALIGEQADDVKLIEQNVERAGDRVERGHNQMQVSVALTRGSRKMCCIVGSLVAIFAAIVIIVAVITVAVILTR